VEQACGAVNYYIRDILFEDYLTHITRNKTNH